MRHLSAFVTRPGRAGWWDARDQQASGEVLARVRGRHRRGSRLSMTMSAISVSFFAAAMNCRRCSAMFDRDNGNDWHAEPFGFERHIHNYFIDAAV